MSNRTELANAFLANTPLSENAGQVSRLKQAWREAEALTDRAVARNTEGLTSEDPDAPLDKYFQESLQTAFRATYNWKKLDNRRMGSDTLLGKISREFGRRGPTLFPVARVKSLARAQKSAVSKRQRVGDSFAIDMFDGHGDESDDADTLAKWFSNLDVLSNTWALAGCFDVVWNGSRVKYAHWEHTQHYVYEIRVRVEALLLKYYADNILTFAVQCEEDFRAAAMQLARDDPPMPWGLALVACGHAGSMCGRVGARWL